MIIPERAAAFALQGSSLLFVQEALASRPERGAASPWSPPLVHPDRRLVQCACVLGDELTLPCGLGGGKQNVFAAQVRMPTASGLVLGLAEQFIEGHARRQFAGE
jgi:hypothetical protein